MIRQLPWGRLLGILLLLGSAGCQRPKPALPAQRGPGRTVSAPALPSRDPVPPPSDAGTPEKALQGLWRQVGMKSWRAAFGYLSFDSKRLMPVGKLGAMIERSPAREPQKAIWNALFGVLPKSAPRVVGTEPQGETALVRVESSAGAARVVMVRESRGWRVDVPGTIRAAGGLSRAPRPAQAVCEENMRELAAAMLAYARRHGGRLPHAAGWSGAIAPYLRRRSAFHCPTDPRGTRVQSYGYNRSLAGRTASGLSTPESLALLFETNSGTRDIAGGAARVARPGRHYRGNNYAFADGHALWKPTVPRFR